MAAKGDRPIRFGYHAQKAGELAAHFLELAGGSMPMLVGAILVAGCGRLEDGSAGVSPSPTIQASPSQSPAGSPSPDPTTWMSYSSVKWGYTFKHPSSWNDLGSLGAPDTEEYLSNEHVGSPSELDASGVFVAISIHQLSTSLCARHGLPNATVLRQDQVTVAGIQSSLYVLNGELPYLELNVLKDTYCYMFSFVFGAAPTRDSNESTALVMLSRTFVFGQPTASAP